VVVKQTFNEPVKVRIVNTVPALAHCEDGEFYYDITNDAGWVTFAQD